MNAKTLITLLVAASSFVPVAVLASQPRPTEVAFHSEARVLHAARRIDRSAGETEAESTTTLEPVIVVGTRPRKATAEARSTSLDCAAWRTLQAGPDARAAGVPRVRACDVL